MAVVRDKVASLATSTGAGTRTSTFASNPAAGDKVILAVWCYTTTAPSSVTDNAGNTYVQDKSFTGNSGDANLVVRLYRADNIALPGAGLLAVSAALAGDGSVCAIAYSGVAAGGPSASNTNFSASNQTGGNSGAAGSATTGLQVGVQCFFGVANPENIATTAPFGQQAAEQDGSSFLPGAVSDQLNAGASGTAAWTWVTSARWSALIVAYDSSTPATSSPQFRPSPPGRLAPNGSWWPLQGSAELTVAVVAIVLGQPIETDSVQSLARAKSRVVGQPAESDVAQTLARSKSKVLGLVVDTGTAQVLVRIKTTLIGQVAQANTAQPLARSKSKALGQPAETNLAQAITRVKARALGQATTTDTAQALARGKTKTLGQVTNSQAAQGIATGAAVAVGQATETGTAQSVTRVKAKALGQPPETDTAQPVTRAKRKALGQVAETDVVQAATRAKAKALGQVNQTNTAQALTRLHVITIHAGAETDLARPLARTKKTLVGQAFEADVAQALTTVGGGVQGILGAIAGRPTATGLVSAVVVRSLIGYID